MPTRIDRAGVERLMREENALLIEVLPRSAYEVLHLPGAINIPLQELDADTAGTMDGTRPIVVYCYDYQ